MFQTILRCCCTLVALTLPVSLLMAEAHAEASTPVEETVIVEGPEPIDLDAWIEGQEYQQGRFGGMFNRFGWNGFGDGCGLAGCNPGGFVGGQPLSSPLMGGWDWQLLPDELIYRSYLAGAHEPRFGVSGFNEKDDGWLWDSSIGGRIGLLRYGSPAGSYPQGVQLDVEAAAFIRQNKSGELVSTDYRVGIPLTFGFARYQTKFGYYHLSSHVGDEFLDANPNFMRINFARDVFVWGHSYQWDSVLRLYFEVGYALANDGGSQPWEFQFGAEYSPLCRTGFRGAPFAAINVHLREEIDFSGNLVVQAGWQWRRRSYGPLLRAGLHYYNGMSPQFQFFPDYEHQIGAGIWYDF